MSKLSRLSYRALANRMGELSAQSKAITAELSALKSEFKSRSAMQITTPEYVITQTSSIRTGLDTPKIKADMGANWIAIYSKETAVETIQIKVNPGQLIAA